MKVLLDVLAVVAVSFGAAANATPLMERFPGQDGFYYVPTESLQQARGSQDGSQLAGPSSSDKFGAGSAPRIQRTYDADNGFGSFTQWVQTSEALASATVIVDGVEYVQLFLGLDLTEGRDRYMMLTALKIFAGGDPSKLGQPLWSMDSGSNDVIALNDGRFAAKGNPELVVLVPTTILQGVQQLMVYSEVNLLNSPYLSAVLGKPDPAIRGQCLGLSRGQRCAEDVPEKQAQVPAPGPLAMLLLGLGLMAIRRLPGA